MTNSNTRVPVSFLLCCLGICGLLWMAACASGADQTQSGANQAQWIRIGETTKDEVVARYGEPDLVRETSEGEIATYQPSSTRRPMPSVEIPTAQPAPFGTSTTQMRPIQPGLGAEDLGAGKHTRPQKEIQIRYDVHGVVREVLE